MTAGWNSLEMFKRRLTHRIAEKAWLNVWGTYHHVFRHGTYSSLHLSRETLGMRLENALVAAVKLSIVSFNKGFAINITLENFLKCTCLIYASKLCARHRIEHSSP